MDKFFDICGTGWGVEAGIPEGIEDMIPLDPMTQGDLQEDLWTRIREDE